MIEQLRALAGCGRPWAEQRAQYALMITEQFQNGGLSAGEYKELMQDLVRMDKLDAEADDLQTKTLLVNCIYAVSQVA